MKKYLSLFLAFALLLTLLPLSALAEGAPEAPETEKPETILPEEAKEPEAAQDEAQHYLLKSAASGSCGDNVTWTLTDDGVLTISGSGAMWNNMNYDESPWYKYRSSITSVSIQYGVTKIGFYAFYSCSNLTSVSIPSSVTSIGQLAFDGCSSLTSVSIPSSVTSIGASAFEGCRSLTSVSIPAGVTSIKKRTFYQCTSLTSVSIPAGVTSIEQLAFSLCSSLTSVSIPSSVTSIEENAFGNCEKLQRINVDSANSYYVSVDDVLYNKSRSLLVQCPAGKSGRFTVPAGVTVISNYAFYGCTSLSSVILPSGIKTIGEWAFNSCTSLSSVILPPGVTTIGDKAFSNSRLSYIFIPASVTSIGKSAFYSTSRLTRVFYGGTASDWAKISIGTNNSELLSATIYFDCSCGENAYWTLKNGTLTIHGTGSIKDYITSNPSWYAYRDSITDIVIEDGITDIGSYAFYSLSHLRKAYIPSSVTDIGTCSFGDCSSLEWVIIPSSVTTIAKYAFYNCSLTLYGTTGSAAEAFASSYGYTFGPGGICGENAYWWFDSGSKTLYIEGSGPMKDYKITSSFTAPTPWWSIRDSIWTVIIRPDITAIGYAAFYKCQNLANVSIPGSGQLSSIHGSAFDCCSGLKSIYLPDTLTDITSGAFNGCTALTYIRVDSGNTRYCSDNGVLYNKAKTELIRCPEGKSGTLIVPKGVTAIGEEACQSCSKLLSVILPSGLKRIREYAFYDCRGLTVIELPSSIESIESSAFNYCTALANVYYRSTTSGWQTIQIGSGNAKLSDAPRTYRPVGETGRDNVRSLKDAAALFSWWNGKSTLAETQLGRCDVNGDGTVDLRDASLVYQLVGMGLT